MSTDPNLAIFQAERRRLAGLAYRMTGSVTESEDILQQAWIIWSRQRPDRIESPGKWLGTIVTRLCLDFLKSAHRRRETYIGAWLPEPWLQDEAPDAEQDWIVTEDVSIALILTLDKLTPEMRAGFILRDAFDFSFDEIATVVGRSPENCRQLVSRARRRIAGAEMPAQIPTQDAQQITKAFWQASRGGDMQALLDLFTEEVEIHTDGGGKVPAAMNVLKGKDRAARFFVGIARKGLVRSQPFPPLRRINGSPGVVSVELGDVVQTTALDIRDGRIAAVWITRNPDKLRHLQGNPAIC
ncbi:RNA polymerase sigma factor SigJ [Paracoccus saliphilus]|uniref:RNA polymerase sigma factor SigJ n=1 Tax=Paracoccus saliphilus TaxID=405559 RepID=A0AA45W374_9RHOB|nr:RNA polymerase sigma factor SigJ [Paracoccus saliphilus]WCR04867.1 RNA polymerase sigma factor SigJ [Paracoccus saliphilus]SIS73353.1 RNA polymerase sigma-70 factor, ECF subfamily [Paracoccus saliphilus]